MAEKQAIVLLLKPFNDEDKAYGFCSSKRAALISTLRETVDLETLSAIDKLLPIAMRFNITKKTEKRELQVSAAEAAAAGADKGMKSSPPRIPTQAPFITGGLFEDEDHREIKSHEKQISYSAVKETPASESPLLIMVGGVSPMAEAWKTKEGKALFVKDKWIRLYLEFDPSYKAYFITGCLFQHDESREIKSHEKQISYSADTLAWFARGGASPTAEARKMKEGKTLIIRDQEMILYGVLSYFSIGHINGQPGPSFIHGLVIHPGASHNGFHHDHEDIEDSEEEEGGDGAREDEGGARPGNEDGENLLAIFETVPIGPMLVVDQRDKRTLPTVATFCGWVHQCWANIENDGVAAQVPDRRNLWPGYTIRVYEGGPNNTEHMMEQGLDEIEEGWECSFFRAYVRRIEVQQLVQPNPEEDQPNEDVQGNQEVLVQPNED